MVPNPVFLLEKPHGQKSLEGYSLWRYKESGTTYQVNTKNSKKTHTTKYVFSYICIQLNIMTSYACLKMCTCVYM